MCAKNWFCSVFCHCAHECDCVFFGNSCVDKLLAGFFAVLFCKAKICRNCRADKCDCRIGGHFFEKKFCRHRVVVFCIRNWAFCCLTVKRRCPVPKFFVFFCWFVATAFERIYVDNNWMINVLYFLECFD